MGGKVIYWVKEDDLPYYGLDAKLAILLNTCNINVLRRTAAGGGRTAAGGGSRTAAGGGRAAACGGGRARS
ncbi:hypothetical protein M5689_012255 [Euphorbia peplus]|nr:hypothetical protein M5689_012255 [Euphorbia peplus]